MLPSEDVQRVVVHGEQERLVEQDRLEHHAAELTDHGIGADEDVEEPEPWRIALEKLDVGARPDQGSIWSTSSGGVCGCNRTRRACSGDISLTIRSPTVPTDEAPQKVGR